jgi:hypothetical protein
VRRFIYTVFVAVDPLIKLFELVVAVGAAISRADIQEQW